MGKSRTGIAVILLATVLSSPASARGLHFGVRLGLGGIRHAMASMLFGGRLLHGRGRHVRSGGVHYAQPRGVSPRNAELFSNPVARAEVAAGAAMAGWHGSRSAGGWWRHGNGGYGWVGPLFWPFAYDDIYDYAIWGDHVGFWDYGYPDIYAGIFAPYNEGDLNDYLAQRRSSRRMRNAASLADMCGSESQDIAALPVDQIGGTVQPTDAQRAALDEVAKASTKAAQTIRAACPMQAAPTALARLEVMQQRIGAMLAAVELIRPPLENLYDVLDDAQRTRLNALAEDQRKVSAAKVSLVKGCSAETPVAPEWPAAEIESALHPNDDQRAPLKALQDASAQASDVLKAACPEDDEANPVARVEAVDRRLDSMMQAVNLVHDALADFYQALSDEQKAQFEAIGPKRAGS